jgi:hypothetical protein
MTMAFGDLDRDGDLDAYLATTALPPPPDKKFGVVYEGSKPVIPRELQEYWGLLYPPGSRPVPTEAGQFDHLYRNDGGHFTEITTPAGIDGPFFTLSINPLIDSLERASTVNFNLGAILFIVSSSSVSIQILHWLIISPTEIRSAVAISGKSHA